MPHKIDMVLDFQYGSTGKGLIAGYMANLGIEVIDCGVPVLSMHSPFEVISKIDLYHTFLAYKTFFQHMKA